MLPCIIADPETSPFLFISSEIHHWPKGKQQPGGAADPTGGAEAACLLLARPEPSASAHAARIQRHAVPKHSPQAHGFQSKELDFDYYFEIIVMELF